MEEEYENAERALSVKVFQVVNSQKFKMRERNPKHCLQIFSMLTTMLIVVGADNSNYCTAVAVKDRIGEGCDHPDKSTCVIFFPFDSQLNLTEFIPFK